MRTAFLTPAYVKFVPEPLDDGTLYISEYGTAVHKCCCGCGSEVVTPLGPTDWKLGKEDLRCRSIRRSETGICRLGHTIGSSVARSSGRVNGATKRSLRRGRTKIW